MAQFSLKLLNNHLIIVLTVSISRLLLCSAGRGVKVTFYEHYDKEGSSVRLSSVKACTPLPNRWQESVSSVDTHGSCLILFENPDCTGKYIRLGPGTATYVPNLKRLRFNDLIASAKPCPASKLLAPGRYAIQNANDRKYLTAQHLTRKGYTAVDTEKWRDRISQQWDVTVNRDGTYWLIPRIHFTRNPLTYDMRRYTKDEFPEIGMFKEREYWLLRNVKADTFMIKNDDSRKCLVMEDHERLIEQDYCDKESKNQQWIFHSLNT